MNTERRRTRVVRVGMNGTPGGVGTRFKILAEHHNREEIELSVIYIGRADMFGAQISKLGVPVYELNAATTDLRGLSFGGVVKLLTLLQRINPDVVHSSIGTANFISSVSGRLQALRTLGRRKPYLVTEEVSIPERKLLSRMKFMVSHRLCDRVIAVSNATKRYLIVKELAKPSKVQVVPNTYPTPFEATLERQRNYPSDAEPFRVLMVSRLSEEKNHRFALNEFARAEKMSSLSLELHIAGNGGHMQSLLEATAASLGVQDKVKFLGFRSDVQELMTNADLYLLPSTTESFGIALVEAMRCKVPVLASAVGGLPEVMEGYPEGHLLPLEEGVWADAIVRVAHMSLADRQKIGEEGFDLAGQRYSPTRYVRDLEKLYIGAPSSSSLRSDRRII